MFTFKPNLPAIQRNESLKTPIEHVPFTVHRAFVFIDTDEVAHRFHDWEYL